MRSLKCLFLIITPVALSAQDSSPSPVLRPLDECASCAQLWPSRGPDWIVTPNAGPCVVHGADLFVTGEFIYWTAHQDKMGFALLNETLMNSSSLESERGEIYHPNWHLEPGFKIGLGMLFDHDGWDIYTNFTSLITTSTRESASNTPALSLYDLRWMSTEEIPNLISEAAQWHHHFSTIDLEFGRNFFISRYLHLRPHFGFKGSWQEQTMDVRGISLSDSIELLNEGAHKICVSGVGIRAGLDSAWHFTRSLSILGDVAMTAFWENFEVSANIFQQNLETTLFNRPFYAFDHFHGLKSVLEFYLGLCWETWFYCNEYHFSAQAGWEEQIWSSQNQFLYFSGQGRLGDLSLQGLTMKARFDF